MKTIGRLAALALASAALAACNARDGRSDHPGDADSGQAAPATVPTVTDTEGPDSTAGMSARTGRAGVAGDTLGSQAPGGAKPPAPVGSPRRP